MVCMIDKDIIEKANEITNNYNLCNSCLGRLFTKKFQGTENTIIGQNIRNNIKNNKPISPLKCGLCKGLTSEIESLTNLILDTIKDYEFDTFLVGCKVDEDIISFEKKIQERVNDDQSESIKKEINRLIGKKLEKITKKIVDFEKPDIMIKIDTCFFVLDLQIKPVYIYGRYKKFKRDISQTKWFCRTCKGIGCRKCNYSGKLYKNSVEELISKKVLLKTKGDSESFHGCGREDIDALMLGEGRPFILEVNNPKIREFDIKKLEKEINNYSKDKVEVQNLRFVNFNEIERIKEASFRKIYRITISAEHDINIEKLKKAIHCLQGCKIKQRTPNRVAHRRADIVREKQIYQCRLKSIKNAIAILDIETESGTYVKELVSGDNGRTKPNISDMIKNPCTVTYLDVLEVKGG